MPFKQTCNGVSGDADFDSFEMAPWDAGGIQGDKLHDVMYRPIIVHKLDRRTTRNTENKLDTIMLIDTNSPRLTVSPGECHVSHRGTWMKCDLPNDMILRHPAECNENYISTDLDSSAVILNDVTKHDKSYASVSAGRDIRLIASSM